jgi:hypothetical protein
MAPKPRVCIVGGDHQRYAEMTWRLQQNFTVQWVSRLSKLQQALAIETTATDTTVVILDVQALATATDALPCVQVLCTPEHHPEVIVLIPARNLPDVKLYLRAGACGCVEKDLSETVEVLSALCIKANSRWYRRCRRLQPSLLQHPLALLGGVVVAVEDPLSAIEGTDAQYLAGPVRALIQRAIEHREGQLMKCIGNGFLALFKTVGQAVQAAATIHQAFIRHPDLSPNHSLRLRSAVHWDTVSCRRTPTQDEITGPAVLQCLRSTEKAGNGQLIFSSQARAMLSQGLERSGVMAPLSHR